MKNSEDTIFLLSDRGNIERVPKQDYESEDLLQRLIESHPELLAGEQIEPDQPVRWLLVRREAGIPVSEESPERWAVDHLLLDQNGRPTFVEVKRSTDTRVRREVVGQMLDYVANAQVYWPIDRIRSLAAETYGGVEKLEEKISELIGDDITEMDPESFWEAVSENMVNGYVRLMFVSDELPRELRRVIEFMNEQMPRIEVLGVEIRQYVGDNLRALVPRVIGQTEVTRQKKRSSRRSTKRTNIDEFLAACPSLVKGFYSDMIEKAIKQDLAINWGSKGFSLRVQRSNGEMTTLLYGFPSGALGREDPFIEVILRHLRPSDNSKAIRSRLLKSAKLKESGKYTLSLVLIDDSLENARRVMNAIWDIASELKHS